MFGGAKLQKNYEIRVPYRELFLEKDKKILHIKKQNANYS